MRIHWPIFTGAGDCVCRFCRAHTDPVQLEVSDTFLAMYEMTTAQLVDYFSSVDIGIAVEVKSQPYQNVMLSFDVKSVPIRAFVFYCWSKLTSEPLIEQPEWFK